MVIGGVGTSKDPRRARKPQHGYKSLVVQQGRRLTSYWFRHEGSKRAGMLGVLNPHPVSLEVLNDEPDITYVMQSALKL